MSNKEKRFDELDIKSPRKINYSKDLLRLNNYFKISSVEGAENCTKALYINLKVLNE